MRKQLAAIILTLTMAGTLAACGSKPAENPQSGTQQTVTAGQETSDQESQAQPNADDTAGNSQESADNSEEGIMTGTLQENKGFMFLLTSSDDGETYVFSLTEDQEGLLDDYKEGDSLKVTYTNGLPTPDNTETVVVSVEKTE